MMNRAREQAHIEPWCDAPNMALLHGLRPAALVASEQQSDPAGQVAQRWSAALHSGPSPVQLHQAVLSG